MMKSNLSSFMLTVLIPQIFVVITAYAEKMDSKTHDLVVSKMERVLSLMDENDNSRPAAQQRLADLLAERARARFMTEIESNCDGCKGSKSDRDQAVKLYENLRKNVNLKGDGRILFQLAHLYQMAGQNRKAQVLFEDIIRGAKFQKTSQEIVTRSYVGLADLQFQKGDFKSARKNYVTALSDRNLENRAFVIYNKAWAEFNLGQLNTAIQTLQTLLSNPQQITRQTDAGEFQDTAFQTDMLRDLATFYTRRSVTNKDIAKFESLIPEGKRKEMLMHFAQETDRIGQKQAAQTILEKYLNDKTLTQDERLHAFIMKAQVSYDNGQNEQSLRDFSKAAETYKSQGCKKPEDCVKLQKAMKYYVTELHRSKKVKPDSTLLNSYSIYTKIFPDDKEMLQRGAQVAVEISQYAVAVQFYRNISTNRAFTEKEQNEALLNEVTTAEKSNNANLKKDSYLYFVKNSSDEVKKFEVRYQLAYLDYQQKKFQDSDEAFYKLAKEKKGNVTLRKKSADLSLDSLAQIKNDSKLEDRAWEYAKMFPQARKEFETLARKALMNQVAMVSNSKNPSTSDLRKLLNKTFEVNLSSATSQEKILFYTNASALSLQLNDQDTFIKSQLLLLQQPGLEESKKQTVYISLAAYYEKHLDFKQAYNWSKRVKSTKSSAREHEFRLGTLADLAQIKSENHYRAALKAGLKGSRALIVRSRLVALSKNPIAELKKQAPELKRNPQVLNDLVLYVYAKTGNKKALTPLLKSKELKNRSAANFILTQDIYKRIAQLSKKTAHAKLRSRPAQALQNDTVKRVKMLTDLDGLLKESLRLKDLTAQMMVLDTIAAENLRLANDLRSLPQPKGLTPAQLAQYENILSSRLKPFVTKAQIAEQKRQEIWNQSSVLAGMIKDYNNARPEIQKLMRSQLQLLSQVSGDGRLKSDLRDALSSSQVSMSDLNSARKSVSKNPDSTREIENLKILETKLGHPLMPDYLEARLNSLEKGKRL